MKLSVEKQYSEQFSVTDENKDQSKKTGVVEMAEKKCSCCCNNAGKMKEYHTEESKQKTLAELPVGTKATIVKIMPKSRGCKKLADVGIVPGSELLIEAHAPFGGLIRVKVMETSMALHKDAAANIVMDPEKE